ncbi:hypothetical protein LXL04_008869 [Taraxacum kok-saghyz]
MELLTLTSSLFPNKDSRAFNVDEIFFFIAKLCTSLEETKKSETYYLLSRLIQLLLTLSVSTATTERGFSAMKLCKTRLRNKMTDGFPADILVVYIEKEIAENFDSDSVIVEFKNVQGRRAEL